MNIDLMPVDSSIIQPGQVAQVDLYDAQGRLLLIKGGIITSAIAQRASEQAICTLAKVSDASAPRSMAIREASSDPIAAKTISKQVHRGLVHTLHQIYHEASLITPDQLNRTMAIVEMILEELKGSDKLALNFAEFEHYDHYTYNHSVNVAIMSAALGLTMGLNELQLRNLTLGALLHDIGKLSIPIAVLNKAESLSALEFNLVQRHPLMGLKRLNGAAVPPVVKYIIAQHHEKVNGTGYPNGLRGKAIHFFAQLVSIADVFDALISDRPYRKGLPPYHAFEIIIAQTQTAFSEEAVKLFKKCISLYPEKAIVTLNTGEIGKVIAVPASFPTRPLVQVFYDEHGKYQDNNYFIDLMKELNRFIASIQFQPPRGLLLK